jgi:hypothetical protein
MTDNELRAQNSAAVCVQGIEGADASCGRHHLEITYPSLSSTRTANEQVPPVSHRAALTTLRRPSTGAKVKFLITKFLLHCLLIGTISQNTFEDETRHE